MTADEVVAAVFGDTDDSAIAVDHVFAVLGATYGADWTRRLGTAPIVTTKTAWAHHLSEFTHSTAAKRSIMWALKNPPETPPNAIQFRNLCRMAPSPKVLALPEPKADPERLAAEVAKLAPLRERFASTPSVDFKAWAKRLIANPEMTTQASLQMARNALGVM
jgi:hypothetical protein